MFIPFPPARPQIVNLSVPTSSSSEGKNTVLTCLVSGIPTPDITWLKDGTVLSTNDHIVISLISSNESQLVILEATFDDAGSYTCNASSIGGTAAMTHFVQVEGIGRSDKQCCIRIIYVLYLHGIACRQNSHHYSYMYVNLVLI